LLLNNIYSVTAVAKLTFPKIARLRKRTEYLLLTSAQNKISVRGFLLVWRENNLQVARLGITASKKIGCAVVRNRVKRFVREYFRCNRLKIAIVDINLIARRESAQMTFSHIEQELTKAFHCIGVPICSKASSCL
jgi:ribonuclease P protein component